MCLRSLVEEIMFNAGHLLAAEEAPRETVDQPEPSKPCLKKPGRGFRHALSKLYIRESGRYGYKTRKKCSSATVSTVFIWTLCSTAPMKTVPTDVGELPRDNWDMSFSNSMTRDRLVLGQKINFQSAI